MTYEERRALTMTHEEQRALITKKAVELWQGFDKNERTGVRFGMFPAGPMKEAARTLCDIPDHIRLLACALMDCAKRDGGMRS